MVYRQRQHNSDYHTHQAKAMTRGNPGKTNPSVSSIRLLSAIVFIGIYGLFCYNIGLSSRSIDQLTRIDGPVVSYAPVVSTPQRELDESQFPYQCGVVFFYHIPSTGGSTINKWMWNFSPKQGGNVKYFTHWGRHHQIGNGHQIQNAFVSEHDGGMNAFVQNLDQNEWRIAHCHHNSLHLNESEHLLDLWRLEVETQGCHFIGTVMFRESLSHTLSLYKHLNRYQSTREQWKSHLNTTSRLGHWATQLDFFLYNNLARNPHGVSKEEKVRRGLELLQKHFDLVTVGDHARYKETLLKMTGWEDIAMPRRNTHKGVLNFQKEEVEELQKLLTNNGDIDFIYEVKKMYDAPKQK